MKKLRDGGDGGDAPAATAAHEQTTRSELDSQGAALDADAARAIARIAKRPPKPSYRRLGLVMGNKGYPTAALKNPINDATAVHDTLRQTGWDATLAVDQRGEEMFDTKDAFVEKVQKGDAVLVYFAGHGCEYQNKNYLLPLDFPKDDKKLPRKSINLHDLLDELRDKGARFILVLLDCCREFAGMTRSTRSTASGLASITAQMPSGTVIGFACAPGMTAADGAGDHGVYTEHIRKNPAGGQPQAIEN